MSDQFLKIVIIDDDEDDRLLFTEAIAELNPNAQVRPFPGGQEFFDFYQDASFEERPHIIFLDYNMPILGGPQIYQLIKKNVLFTDIPTAMFSTHINPLVVDELKEIGIDHCLLKPNTFSKLKSVLHNCIHLLPALSSQAG